MIILSKEYNGSPLICYEYDILIGPKETIEQHIQSLMAVQMHKNKDWMPTVRYI